LNLPYKLAFFPKASPAKRERLAGEQLEMSEFKLLASRMRMPRRELAAVRAAHILPSFERCTLTRASRRLRNRFATTALSRPFASGTCRFADELISEGARDAGEYVREAVTRYRRTKGAKCYGFAA